MTDTAQKPATGAAPANGTTEAAAKRVRPAKLTSRPLGLHAESAPAHGDKDALSGTVSLGWLRTLLRTVGRDMPDTATVTFSDDHTEVV